MKTTTKNRQDDSPIHDEVNLKKNHTFTIFG